MKHYKQINHKIKTTLVLCRSLLSPNCSDSSTGSQKVCCEFWHQTVSSRSLKSCKVWGTASMDHTLNLLSCSLNHSWTISCRVAEPNILLKWGKTVTNEGVFGLHWCLRSWKCQSNIYMNARTQGFVADHCSDHQTVSTSLLVPPLVVDRGHCWSIAWITVHKYQRWE